MDGTQSAPVDAADAELARMLQTRPVEIARTALPVAVALGDSDAFPMTELSFAMERDPSTKLMYVRVSCEWRDYIGFEIVC